MLLNVTDAAGGDLGPAPGMQSLSELTGGANPFDGIDVGTANTPSFVDLDGDGDLDMVVGENYGVLHVFDNNDADAGFTELTGGASPLHGISVGAYSTPSFVDLDGDGDLDMVVGEYHGALKVFDNNDADAGFTELTGGANPLHGIDVGSFSAPSFVDLDGDGDLDMVVGENGGTLKVFDNNDADAGFTELTGGANPFDGIDVGLYSTPSFVDLDGDGDLDMVVGQGDGTLNSFENTAARGQTITVNVSAEAENFTGTANADTLNGDSDANVMDGLGGADSLFGGAGADTLNGGKGYDTLEGGKGADLLDGGKGEDILEGGNGSDLLHGGSGNDLVSGGKGDDTLNGDAGEDTLNGGDDFDTVLFSGDIDTTVDLRITAVQDTGHGMDVLSGIEALETGSGADALTGTDDANHFVSGEGKDTILAEGGDDTVTAGKGDDDVNGGLGNDDLTGGKGDDSLFGGKGADVLRGNKGRDVLDGYKGADALFGGDGGDWLDGGKGDDLLTGGVGNDNFIFTSGDGNDTVNDFDALNSKENINLAAVLEIVDFADLTANHMVQVGNDVVIDDGDALTITLLNVDLGDLGGNDFIF